MTLEELQTLKAALLARLPGIAASQEYTIGDGVINRRNRQAEFDQVWAAIKQIDAQIEAAGGGANGPRRMYRIVPGC